MSAKTSEPFARSAAIYDALYSTKDYDREARVILDRLNGLLWGRRGHLVEFGCGTGQFSKRFKDAGWQVHGVEPCEGMARIALDRLAPDAVLWNGKLGSGEPFGRWRPCRFDAAVIPFNVLGYAAAEFGLDACLSDAANSLVSGGAIVFDFISTTAAATILRPTEKRSATLRDGRIVSRQSKRRFCPFTCRINYDFTFTVGDECWLESHSVRTFTAPEVVDALGRHSFSGTAVTPIDESTWEASVFARKQ
jgi:SAM-dependent methyltransferase